MNGEFYNHLLISSICPFRTEKYSIISPPSQRLAFLNGLALLLNGANPCTSVYVWIKNKKVLISRNERLPDEDKCYFNHFFGLIRIYSRFCLTSNSEGMLETYLLLRSLVSQYNKEKLIKRILDPLFNDSISNLKKLVNLNINDICAQVDMNNLKQSTTDYNHLTKQKMNLIDFVSLIFDSINEFISLRDSIRFDKNKPNMEIIEKVQTIAALFYNSNVLHSIIGKYFSTGSNSDSDRIHYYFDKVSAHFRSLNLILKCLRRQETVYGEIYKNIKWEFVEPIENQIKLFESPSITLENIWSKCNLPNDESKIDFKQKVIGNRLDKYDSNLELSTCLHSEIRMIDYLIEQNIGKPEIPDVEIGIAKLPCFPCSLYIEKLNEKFHRQFCVALLTTHGKMYSNWTFRTNEDESIKQYINDELYKLIKRGLEQSHEKFRNKSGDSDKQEINEDNDDIDIEFTEVMSSLGFKSK